MSLRLRAVLIAGVALAVLWLAAAAWMMRGVQSNLEHTLDGRLAMSARMVAGLLQRSALGPGALNADLAHAVRVGGGEGIACEVRAMRGEVLVSTEQQSPAIFASLPAGYSTRQIQGKDWRVYVLQAGDYQITTADRIDQRSQLGRDLLMAAGVPFLIALIGGLIALWIGIGHGLAPLRALCQQLRGKATDDTTPITVAHPPKELRTVLDALNGLLGRLARALTSQRAFTDAAAHELRTPLTVIDTHLQVIRLSDARQAEASLGHAEEGVRRLRHTLDQMMDLARTESGPQPATTSVGLSTILRALAASRPEADRQRLHLALDPADPPCPLPRTMLETAVRNLLDNALRYAPADSAVHLSLNVDTANGLCCITVADRGPGLDPAQATRIGQRFWRGDQGRRDNSGSGLGISIVQAIAQRYGADLCLSPREGGGLQAELRFPLNLP
ncbi:ATP-binding protein [Bordetella trematum]|uniref:ATP-binding protein n=1 Tax=Bordetella trematum TaxID=123899 RepID=UPI00052E75CF|nr:ATP-binding protein [Bordetella trematum]